MNLGGNRLWSQGSHQVYQFKVHMDKNKTVQLSAAYALITSRGQWDLLAQPPAIQEAEHFHI